MSSVPSWVVGSLGRRVVLTERVAGFPAGRTGLLVSIQAGVDLEGRASGDSHATVSFELGDFWEENVPFHAMRPLQHGR